MIVYLLFNFGHYPCWFLFAKDKVDYSISDLIFDPTHFSFVEYVIILIDMCERREGADHVLHPEIRWIEELIAVTIHVLLWNCAKFINKSLSIENKLSQ